jgi:hypothetical protein
LAELLPILPHDRRSRFEPNADPASVVDIGAFGGDAPDDVLGGQYRCHLAPALTGSFPSNAIPRSHHASIPTWVNYGMTVPQVAKVYGVAVGVIERILRQA